MNDTMNEVVNFSPYGGQLILEPVAGDNNSFFSPENSVSTALGADRDMYSYVPASGCYDNKQGQVLMVLRDDSTKESAEEAMKELGLDKLAEEKHFVLLFPNPQKEGWNYRQTPDVDDDLPFLVRCFATLPKSKGKVAGFNGMIFYIGITQAASALLSSLSALHPIDCAAMMISDFPNDYVIPNGKRQQQVAWICGKNNMFTDYLLEVNQASFIRDDNDVQVFQSKENENVKVFLSSGEINEQEIRKAWDKMFSETRRWRNDTYGHYQKRTNFTKAGFIAHVQDSSLGINDGFKHTWYEYIPPKLREAKEKVPLLFYFHGGNAVPLYGAEQSDWHRIADREGFIVVYPKASTKKRWNCWNDENEPSDFAFVMALIEHMKEVHPIDTSRIYISGFSMGSMMTNALACVYPDVFAAAAPCNAQNLGYFNNVNSTLVTLKMETSDGLRKEQMEKLSPCHIQVDEKKKKYDYQIPVIQSSGLLDDLAMKQGWPIKEADDSWLQTIDFWKGYNHIPVTEFKYNESFETGLAADESFYDGTDERFIHHRWYTEDEKKLPLYEFVVAKRMPHAIDLRQFEIAWKYMKKYSRNEDGTLNYERI